MKTLRELEFEVEPDDDVYKMLDGDIEACLDLTQKEAVMLELAYIMGNRFTFDTFKSKVEKFGGNIVWEDE